MANIAGIRVYELRDQFSEQTSWEQGPSAVKAWLVPNWSDRYTVANALLGLVTYSNNTIDLNPAGAYPDSPNLRCMKLSIRGLGTISQGPNQIAWTSAALVAEYGLIPFQFSRSQDPGGINSFDPTAPLVYATQELDYGAMVVDTPPGSLTLNDGSNTVLNQGYGKTVSVVTMSLTLHRLPYMVPATIRTKVGQLNNAAFFGCDTGTLRFDGIHTSQQFGPDGLITQETNLKFAARPEAPWDQILHPNGSFGWVQVMYNGSSVLNSFDFTTLIPSAYTANV